MNSKELTQIRKEIARLEKLPLRGISRAANMLCLQFGDLVETDLPYRGEDGELSRNEKGELNRRKELLGEYSLHIQCTFRWFHDDEIILAKDDLYQPSSKLLDNGDLNWDDFDYDSIGNNHLDEVIATEMISKTVTILVSSVSVSKFGDLKIKFANGYTLEVFIDATTTSECWRFFKADAERDLVMLGVGLEGPGE